MRHEPQRSEYAVVAKGRDTIRQLPGIGRSIDKPAAGVASKPDPRLVDLVRLLARQAAQDFVAAEYDRKQRDGLPE